MLHLYGRYCNANKFAGEVDLFEALDAVKTQYPIDENRILVRGFSMGGAAAWQFAAHYAGLWAAAAPGAGFSETAEFLKVYQNEADQADVVGSRSCTTCTMRPITRRICSTARRSPTAARSTGRSRRPT